MNVNIGYAILPFHDFHLRGQTNVAYVFKHASLNTDGIKFIKLIIV